MDTRNGNNESSDGTTGEKINKGIAFIYQLCYNYVTKVITSSKYIKRGVICTDKKCSCLLFSKRRIYEKIKVEKYCNINDMFCFKYVHNNTGYGIG